MVLFSLLNVVPSWLSLAADEYETRTRLQPLRILDPKTASVTLSGGSTLKQVDMVPDKTMYIAFVLLNVLYMAAEPSK